MDCMHAFVRFSAVRTMHVLVELHWGVILPFSMSASMRASRSIDLAFAVRLFIAQLCKI